MVPELIVDELGCSGAGCTYDDASFRCSFQFASLDCTADVQGNIADFIFIYHCVRFGFDDLSRVNGDLERQRVMLADILEHRISDIHVVAMAVYCGFQMEQQGQTKFLIPPDLHSVLPVHGPESPVYDPL